MYLFLTLSVYILESRLKNGLCSCLVFSVYLLMSKNQDGLDYFLDLQRLLRPTRTSALASVMSARV